MVGQPSVPTAPYPDGAFSIGIDFGGRSLDLLLVDCTAQQRERVSLAYDLSDPDPLLTKIGLRLR